MRVILVHKQSAALAGIHELKRYKMQLLGDVTAEIGATSTGGCGWFNGIVARTQRSGRQQADVLRASGERSVASRVGPHRLILRITATRRAIINGEACW